MRWLSQASAIVERCENDLRTLEAAERNLAMEVRAAEEGVRVAAITTNDVRPYALCEGVGSID